MLVHRLNAYIQLYSVQSFWKLYMQQDIRKLTPAEYQPLRGEQSTVYRGSLGSPREFPDPARGTHTTHHPLSCIRGLTTYTGPW